MLELKNISKNYEVAGRVFPALKDINIKFRANEFVSILGPSGSGKTTMLNIIGGLDRYSSGDLIIRGKSTKTYKDKDWDSYRNHSVGFVFQTYNLIAHQSVLANVELALTLSGVNKQERRIRAKEILTKVGLKDHINKKPTQLSGGQMQRVAIARALINDPDIILADEPTGALDSKTSGLIMDLLKEIAKDKLVIMVTHNDAIAEKYSSRIIKILDGSIVHDSHPFVDAERAKRGFDHTSKKTFMSFWTALNLSFNNLLTKKTRTILTAFAGSIGIIGIALILSLSTGANRYIERIQEDTLTNYPIQIYDNTIDLSNLTNHAQRTKQDTEARDPNTIYPVQNTQIMLEGIQSFSGTTENNLKAFKEYIETHQADLKDLTNGVDYGYNIKLNIFKEIDGEIMALNPFSYVETPRNSSENQSSATTFPEGNNSFSIWEQLMGNQELLESQYELLIGEWPQEKEDLVLFVNKDNEISDFILYQLGILNPNEISDLQDQLKKDENIQVDSQPISLEDLLGLTFKYIPSVEFYEEQDDGTWLDKSNDKSYLEAKYDEALEVKISAVVRPNKNSSVEVEQGGLGYTKELTEYIIDTVNQSELASLQRNKSEVDVFTNKEFLKPGEEIQPAKLEELPQELQAYVLTLPEDKQDEALLEFSKSSQASLDENLQKLGVLDLESPNFINIYPNTYENKGKIDDFIVAYNNNLNDKTNEIKYNDIVGLIMSSVSTIINVISSLLIAFVSISLVVSSIMIGIITYVSVLERTKEIGILKSVGASRKDISRVFNAETTIIGLLSGSLGIGLTLLLMIPVNSIIFNLTGVTNFAYLPIEAALILIAISIGLSFISGLIPSRIASKKDAVEALRSE